MSGIWRLSTSSFGTVSAGPCLNMTDALDQFAAVDFHIREAIITKEHPDGMWSLWVSCSPKRDHENALIARDRDDWHMVLKYRHNVIANIHGRSQHEAFWMLLQHITVASLAVTTFLTFISERWQAKIPLIFYRKALQYIREQQAHERRQQELIEQASENMRNRLAKESAAIDRKRAGT